MKPYLRSLLAALVVSFTLSGCDLFDKVDDVTFEGVLPLEFVIDENLESDEPVVYSDAEILNALEDDEIEKYKDKIKSITLNRITYEITDYEAPGTVGFSNGSLKIGASNKKLVAVSVAALTNKPETDLQDFESDAVEIFANALKNDKQVTVMLDGTLSTTPVAFRLKTKFYVTVVAEVL